MATIDEVVRESGVSRSTVFRFLNGSNVRSDAKNSIIRAMEKLEYSCEALFKQQNITLEISISNNFEGFKGFSDVVQGITQRADEKGIAVNIKRRSGGNIGEDYSNRDTEGISAVIVVGKNRQQEEEEAKKLLEKRIPHVFVNRIIDTKGINYVSVDVERAAYDAIIHLISLGHTKISTVARTEDMRIDRHKIEGYKRALADNGIEVSPLYCRELTANEEWEKTIDELLSLEDLPTAFFGICDSHAMKFIHAARAKGLRVPGDIAVLGMDDIDTAQYFRPALTTVHIPFKKMGILAVDNILQMISDSQIAGINTIVAHKLIVRESCGFKKF